MQPLPQPTPHMEVTYRKELDYSILEGFLEYRNRKKIARELGEPYSTVKWVINEAIKKRVCKNTKILAKAFELALENKSKFPAGAFN